MSRENTVKRKVIKLLQEQEVEDSFEISIILKESVDDVNKALDSLMDENGNVLLYN